MDQSKKLGEEKIGKLMLQFTLPAIVVLLASAIYNVIDRIFIGNSMGASGIAGITIAFPVMMVVAALATLIGTGGAALLSIKLGEGKRDEAERIIGLGLTLMAVVSVLVTIFGVIFITPILRAYGASDTVLPFAQDYLTIILLGTLFSILSPGMNSFIRAEGNPQKAMATLLIGPLLNIILAPLFIFGFGWGMKGAALATVLAQLASTIWVLSHFLSGKSSVKFYARNLKPDGKLMGAILLLGIAPFGVPFTSSVLNVIINNSLARYGGDLAVSGMGIVVSLQVLSVIPLLGISQGMQPIVGFNYGARQFGRVKEGLKYALIMGVIVTLPLFLATQFIPSQIVALFDSHDQELIDFGAYAMRVFLLCLPIICVQSIGSGYFQAVGKARLALIVTLARPLVFFIPALLLLPQFFGLQGVLISGPVTDILAFLVTGTWLLIEVQKLNRKSVEEATEKTVASV